MVERIPQIIIVDDDLGMGQAVVRLLTAVGWLACTFPSAEAALESDSLATAACLVLDIELPGMSGLELHSRLEEAGVHLPVVFITGHDLQVFREHARSAGACYLTKPFPSSQLLAAVRRHLQAA